LPAHNRAGVPKIASRNAYPSSATTVGVPGQSPRKLPHFGWVVNRLNICRSDPLGSLLKEQPLSCRPAPPGWRGKIRSRGPAVRSAEACD